MGVTQGVKYMLVATFAFALMNVSVKWLAHLPTHEIILFRSVVSLFICLYMIRKKRIPYLGNNRLFLFLRGFTGTIALTLYFYTLQHAPMASAVTLQYLSPIFTAVIAHWFLGEKLRWMQWMFFLLSFIGVCLIKGFDERVAAVYFVTGILSAVFSGVAYASIRKVKNTDDPLVVVLYFPLVSIPIMAVWSLFEWQMPQGWEWLILFMVGIFTQFGQYFMAKALIAENAAKVVSMKYVGTIYALSFGFFLFDEVYSWLALLGIVMVAGGVLMNVFYKNRSHVNP